MEYSDSDEEKSFRGFTIRDLREDIPIAENIPIYTLTPRPAQRNQPKYLWHAQRDDEELSFEIEIPEQTSGNEGEICEAGELNDNLNESDVEGDFSEAIYAQAKMRIVEECEISSDDSVEGEFSFNLDIEDTSMEHDEDNCSDNDQYNKRQESLVPQEQEQHCKISSRGLKRSTIVSPEEVMTKYCCKNNCIKKFSLSQITETRHAFIRNFGRHAKQRQYILDWLSSNRPKEEEDNFVHSICGVKVCINCWLNVLGITRRKFFQLKKQFLDENRRSGIHGNTGTLRLSLSSELALNYLKSYFEQMCEHIPNGNVMHLPSNIRKYDIYEEMELMLASQGQPCCTKTTFNNLWTKYFPNIKIPKENRFSKCDDCSKIKADLRETLDPEKQQTILIKRTGHHEFVRLERQLYLSRGILGHHQPNKYFSIAIDGMDQNKTELPFSTLRYSLLSTAWRLKVHVVGVMVHGRNPIVFLDHQQHAHDSNLTANILLQVFWMHRDRLPDTVYIQMDNTCRENKNQYVFALLAYLIERKVFKEITVSFLPKGHTHVDVDQMFSRLSVAIARSGCLTPTDLRRLIGSCYKQAQGDVTQAGARPQVAQLQHLYAIREWLKPYSWAVHYLRPFHQFRFYLDERGKCLTDFKAWCQSEWDPLKWPPLEILKQEPTSEPETIVPSYDTVDIDRLRGMVKKCVDGGVLNAEEEKVWDGFLAGEEALADYYQDKEQATYCDKHHNKEVRYMPPSDNGWLLDELVARKRPSENEAPDLREVLRESESLLNGEGLIPAYTGPYRPPGHKQREIIRDENVDALKVGMLVALDVDTYKERPQIAEVVSLSTSDTIEVEWYIGSWSTSWKPHKVRRGRNMVIWREVVQKSCVLLFDFELTPQKKLREATKRELKRVYEEN